MASKQKELALKVRANMQDLGVSHGQLTKQLGCGATLVSMFTGDYHKPASGVTLFVLETLTSREKMSRLRGWLREKAEKELPTASSVIRALGIKGVAKKVGVTESSVRRWRKEKDMANLWNDPPKPRVSLAALRLIALELQAKKHLKEGEPVEPDLFNMAEAEPKKPEVETYKYDGAPRASNLSGKLRDLASGVETMPLDVEARKEVGKLVEAIKGVLKGAVEARRKKLEKELEELNSLGV